MVPCVGNGLRTYSLTAQNLGEWTVRLNSSQLYEELSSTGCVA